MVLEAGAYGGELFHGVVPRVLDVEDYKKLTLEELANRIYQVDTAGWAGAGGRTDPRRFEGDRKVEGNGEGMPL